MSNPVPANSAASTVSTTASEPTNACQFESVEAGVALRTYDCPLSACIAISPGSAVKASLADWFAAEATVTFASAGSCDTFSIPLESSVATPEGVPNCDVGM